MTEREKMLAGELYDANSDLQLLQMRDTCKDLCQQFNLLPPSHREEQRRLLEKILGEIQGEICVLPTFWCDYGCQISVGKNFFANHNCVILDAAPVRFGDNVFIGPNCGFYTAGHPMDAVKRRQGLEYARPITVGSDVWFGGGVQVMPGVTIGDDVVIGGGSVVCRDLPSHVVAVGVPCRVLRPITAADWENE